VETLDNILSTLTKEQAMGCLVKHCCVPDDRWMMVINGNAYTVPEYVFGDIAGCRNVTRNNWERIISAYYAERDKPRWVKPDVAAQYGCGGKGSLEYFYDGGFESESRKAEIARTNARREVEAFIRANGGEGRYWIQHNTIEKFFVLLLSSTSIPGAFGCATETLAEAVIERFPAQLRLLAGEAGK
jgi:hypothetical protein